MQQKELRTLVIAIGIWLLVASLGGCSWKSGTGASADPDKEAFGRIMAERRVRCGYVVAPPHVIKDPTTGRLTGIIPDALTAAASNIGYKVDWVEEVGWGTMIEGLNSNRYDMVCTAVWPSGVRAQFAEFSEPLYYSGIGVYVHSNDLRFDKSLDGVNSPAVTIATSDGEISQIIGEQLFPKARKLSLPQLSDNSQLPLNVDQGKADVTFTEAYTGAQYMAAHPGRLKNVRAENPLRVYANTILFHKGATDLKRVFDVAFDEILNSGQIEQITKKYAPQSGAFYQRQFPYR